MDELHCLQGSEENGDCDDEGCRTVWRSRWKGEGSQ
ncbi:hypothetical protein ABID24_003820 [Blautia caecimuris]